MAIVNLQNKQIYAAQLNEMWALHYFEQRHNRPLTYNEDYLRQQELQLSQTIQPAIDSYNEGRISAAELVCNLSQYIYGENA